MKKYILVLFISLFASVVPVFAQQTPINPIEKITSAFQKFKEINEVTIKVPTVVEVPFIEEFANRFNFAVLDMETNSFQPYFYKEQLRSTPVIVTLPGGQSGSSMFDGDTRTFTEFALPQSEPGQTQITLASKKPLIMSSITLFLDQYVALPTSIEIRVDTESGEKIVLAHSPMYTNTVVFPKTSGSSWTVILTYGQPLRITELVAREDLAGMAGVKSLRFLVQPKHNYKVYFDADRSVQMSVGESGNLALDTEVMQLSSISTQVNDGYVLADTDSDTIPDLRDNCVSVSNTDQEDVNTNGRGDACDDFDKDGVMNSIDNCPHDPNYNQADVDGDKIGDVCDKEESRITEKYPWLPMAGISFAGLVLIVLFAITARGMMKKPGNTEN
ncbi:MAG: thrombospondin type 3 repeat-containing protein [Minisyncoccia bacterium]